MQVFKIRGAELLDFKSAHEPIMAAPEISQSLKEFLCSSKQEIVLNNVAVAGLGEVLRLSPDFLNKMSFHTKFSGALTVLPDERITDTFLIFNCNDVLQVLYITKIRARDVAH